MQNNRVISLVDDDNVFCVRKSFIDIHNDIAESRINDESENIIFSTSKSSIFFINILSEDSSIDQIILSINVDEISEKSRGLK